MITRKNKDRLVGLSTDTKPINVENGTMLFCMDEKKTYIFDQAGATWYEYVDPDSPSGGGGLPEVSAEDNGDVLTVVEGAWANAAPTGGGVLVCHVDTQTGALDKTWQEINDADCAVLKFGVGFTRVASAVYIEAADESEYVVVFADISVEGTTTYYQSTATSADGYPVLNDD